MLISFKEQVYYIGRTCRASHIQIKDNLPKRVDTIPALPKLDIAIPLKKGVMRNYQEEGVARGLQLKRFINEDQPGLGKTLQSIATLAGAEIKSNIAFPMLVICPSALRLTGAVSLKYGGIKKPLYCTTELKIHSNAVGTKFVTMEYTL